MTPFESGEAGGDGPKLQRHTLAEAARAELAKRRTELAETQTPQ